MAEQGSGESSVDAAGRNRMSGSRVISQGIGMSGRSCCLDVWVVRNGSSVCFLFEMVVRAK